MPHFETPFIEPEVLLAVMNDDGEQMVTLLSDMRNGEIEYLQKYAARLSKLSIRALADRGVSDVGPRRDPWDPPSFASANQAKAGNFTTMRDSDDRSSSSDP